MSEHCVVRFTEAAKRELQKLDAEDEHHVLSIQSLLRRVQEQGWKLSTNSQLIKVLRSRTHIAEIRDLGRGGYRLFLFWHDEGDVRTLHICRVLPKAGVVGRRRLNDVCDAVEERRRRFLMEG